MNTQLEILDISTDEHRNDLVPLYEKRAMEEKALLAKLNDHWAGVKLLPLDFLEKVKITRTGQYDGIFGVVKTIYDVTYRIQNEDYERETKSEHITYYESIYSGYGNIPDNVLDEIKEPSEYSWAENGVSKIGYLTQKRADIITQDIFAARSAPTALKEKLKSKLSDSSRYGGSWTYVDKSAVVNRVTSEGTPVFSKLNISYVEWKYNDLQGIAYYNPASDTLSSPGLPEDKILVGFYRKATIWWEKVFYYTCLVVIMVVIALIIIDGDFIGIPGWCRPLFYYVGMPILVILAAILSILPGVAKERRSKKKRSQSSKLLFK